MNHVLDPSTPTDFTASPNGEFIGLNWEYDRDHVLTGFMLKCEPDVGKYSTA